MAITNDVGLSTGINWETMIQKITVSNSKPINIIQKKINVENSKSQAFDSIKISLSDARNQMNNLIQNLSKTMSEEEKKANITTEANLLKNIFNKLNSDINSNSTYNRETKTASPLFGDNIAYSIKRKLSKAISIISNNKTLADIGISIQTDGTLKIDSEKLNNAISQSSDSAISLLQDVAKSILSSTDSFSNEIDAKKQNILTSINSMNTSIDKMQKSLDVKAEQMRKKFRSLETLLTKYQGMGDFVSNNLSKINSI